MAYKNDEDRRAYQRAYYQANKDKKKRTKPNPETVKKYRKEHLLTVAAMLPKELVERFRSVAAERGDSQSAIIRVAIEEYIKKGGTE